MMCCQIRIKSINVMCLNFNSDKRVSALKYSSFNRQVDSFLQLSFLSSLPIAPRRAPAGEYPDDDYEYDSYQRRSDYYDSAPRGRGGPGESL